MGALAFRNRAAQRTYRGVVMSERVASHGTALWQAEFPLMVAWAFGPGPTAEAAGTPLPAS